MLCGDEIYSKGEITKISVSFFHCQQFKVQIPTEKFAQTQKLCSR